VNLALRCEVLFYTTSGIIQSVRDTQHLPPGATQQEFYLHPQGADADLEVMAFDPMEARLSEGLSVSAASSPSPPPGALNVRLPLSLPPSVPHGWS
jgi:hypothetical protein